MRIKPIFALLGVLALAAIARAVVIVYTGNLISTPGLAYNATPSLDLQQYGIGGLSAQVTYSSATFAAATFTDGRQSTGSFTIADNTAISTATASDNLTVVSTTGLTSSQIGINGTRLVNGIDWVTMDTTSNTAISIASAIRLNTTLLVSTVTGSAIIYTTAPIAGSYYNAWVTTATAGSALSWANTAFTGGVNNAVVSLNGVTLQQGLNWLYGATSALSATNLATAINANTTLNKLVTAAASGNVVTTTSTLAGTNAFSLASSTNAITTVSMKAGANSATTFAGQITVQGHGFTLALPVLYSTKTAGGTIGGLTNQTTYYVVPIDANTLGLSSTSAVAQTGVYQTFTSSVTGLAADSYSLAALPITGTPGFYWQASNDGTNWVNLAVTSVTVSAYSNPPASTLWAFGYIGNRYVRLNIAAPTTGGLSLQVALVGTN